MKKFSFYIALRYLFAKKKRNAINVISSIAVLAFTVCTAALIIILSAMNGFEDVIFSMYNKYNPDLKISLEEGKFFKENELKTFLEKYKGIKKIHLVLEDNAAIKNHDYQSVCRVKGVSENYFQTNQLSQKITNGEAVLKEDSINYMVLGIGMSNKLSIDVSNPFNLLTLITPRKGDYSLDDPNAISQMMIEPSGEIALDESINNQYVFVPIDFAQELFDSKGEISSIEVYFKNSKNTALAELIKKEMPKGFKALDRMEQQSTLYKMFKSEKWASYAILTFILLIAAFNALGSLTMLVIEKKQDIKTLFGMGASKTMIQKIFFTNGFLISGIGALFGLLIGVALVLIQKEFGLIRMEGAIVESYPVKLKIEDVLLVLSTVFILGIIIGIYPASRSTKDL